MSSLDQVFEAVMGLQKTQGELISEIRTARQERADCERRASLRFQGIDSAISGIQTVSAASTGEIQTWKTQGQTFKWTLGLVVSGVAAVIAAVAGTIGFAKEMGWLH